MDPTGNRVCMEALTANPPSRYAPQKIGFRRRCRSECLPMAPVLGIPLERKFDNYRELNGIKLTMGAPLPSNPQYSRFNPHGMTTFNPMEDPRIKYLQNTVSKNTAKENLSSPILPTDKNQPPEIIDFTELCIRDAEAYKERLRNNQMLLDKLHEQLENVRQDIPKDGTSVLETFSRRRARARSESDPHDYPGAKASGLHHTTFTNGIIRTENGHGDDLVLKRAREERNIPSKLVASGIRSPDSTTALKPSVGKVTKEFECNNARVNSRVTAKYPQNYHHTKLMTNHLTTNPLSVRLSAKQCGISSLRKLKETRTSVKSRRVSGGGTPTLNSIKTIKSIYTPPAAPSNSLAPIQMPNITPVKLHPGLGQEKKSPKKCVEYGESGSEHASDTECSSLEDDDDLGDVDGDYADSITDSEDNYQVKINTTESDKSVAANLLATDSIPGGHATVAPLQPSLFPYVPPYVSFASHNEKGPTVPPVIQKLLKWKLTTITPIVVRKIVLNSGFRLLRKTNDWIGIWGKHMKSPCFKTVRSFQKFNHIPGSFQIGRKDRCWRNLQVQINRHGKKEFGFMPRTYIIPHDLKQLKHIWPKYSQRNAKWIIKPPASARGTGIKVVNRWSQIPKRKPLIVQKYIERPLLINGSKFDLRLYVLVTSINPLKIFMHTDGLARFASVKYSEKSETLHDRYMHLTNYSINKLSAHYAKNEDANACKGHKWTVKSLWTFLQAQGINTGRLWAALRNLVLRTILAGEHAINQMVKMNVGSRYNCYELFGIDVLLDSELTPWLLEVNISPSLHSASPLDLHVKGALIRGILNTVLYQVPPKLPMSQQKDLLDDLGLKGPLCYDKRIFSTHLSRAERLKQSHFSNRNMANREEYMKSILENLTPDDIRCLLIAEDELARSAPLERIFPAANTYKYLNFTESPRYYNRLLDAWETRYGNCRQEGIKVLTRHCEAKTHLIVPPSPIKKDLENRSADEELAESDEHDSDNEVLPIQTVPPARKPDSETKRRFKPVNHITPQKMIGKISPVIASVNASPTFKCTGEGDERITGDKVNFFLMKSK